MGGTGQLLPPRSFQKHVYLVQQVTKILPPLRKYQLVAPLPPLDMQTM